MAEKIEYLLSIGYSKESIIKIGKNFSFIFTLKENNIKTLKFKEKLEDVFDIEVVLQDERITTVQATNYMLEADISRKKRKKSIDALAANIILQTYLDKEKGGRL